MNNRKEAKMARTFKRDKRGEFAHVQAAPVAPPQPLFTPTDTGVEHGPLIGGRIRHPQAERVLAFEARRAQAQQQIAAQLATAHESAKQKIAAYGAQQQKEIEARKSAAAEKRKPQIFPGAAPKKVKPKALEDASEHARSLEYYEDASESERGQKTREYTSWQPDQRVPGGYNSTPAGRIVESPEGRHEFYFAKQQVPGPQGTLHWEKVSGPDEWKRRMSNWRNEYAMTPHEERAGARLDTSAVIPPSGFEEQAEARRRTLDLQIATRRSQNEQAASDEIRRREKHRRHSMENAPKVTQSPMEKASEIAQQEREKNLPKWRPGVDSRTLLRQGMSARFQEEQLQKMAATARFRKPDSHYQSALVEVPSRVQGEAFGRTQLRKVAAVDLAHEALEGSGYSNTGYFPNGDYRFEHRMSGEKIRMSPNGLKMSAYTGAKKAGGEWVAESSGSVQHELQKYQGPVRGWVTQVSHPDRAYVKKQLPKGEKLGAKTYRIRKTETPGETSQTFYGATPAADFAAAWNTKPFHSYNPKWVSEGFGNETFAGSGFVRHDPAPHTRKSKSREAIPGGGGLHSSVLKKKKIVEEDEA
jgi:hypothetical protein